MIRRHVDVDRVKNDLPTYQLDTDYLTKIKGDPPDSKALDIEAMLAAELKIRIYRPEIGFPAHGRKSSFEWLVKAD